MHEWKPNSVITDLLEQIRIARRLEWKLAKKAMIQKDAKTPIIDWIQIMICFKEFRCNVVLGSTEGIG
jgi:hypothetical protein